MIQKVASRIEQYINDAHKQHAFDVGEALVNIIIDIEISFFLKKKSHRDFVES